MSPIYDVFLSHNGTDKATVEVIALRLRDEAGLNPFLGRWHLVPGNHWIPELEKAVRDSGSIAVFLGPGGMSTWHDEEKQLALVCRKRVIPVLLPGARKTDAVGFLQLRTCVDLGEEHGFDRLVAGIKGQAPELFMDLNLERLTEAARRAGAKLTNGWPLPRSAPWSLAEIRRRWPKAFDLGSAYKVVGEFDLDGRLLKLPDSLTHAATFLGSHPNGICFMPPQEFAHLDAWDPEQFDPKFLQRLDVSEPRSLENEENKRWILHQHRDRLVSLPSIPILLARLGVETDEEPITLLFDAARRNCEYFTDWSGRSCHIDELGELPLQEKSGEQKRWFGTRLQHLVHDPISHRFAKGTGQPLILVEGRAGSGKSVLLRQLHHRLSLGEDRIRGPSIRLDARRMKGAETFGQGVARALDAPHLTELAETLARLPHIASSVWLLVDGLDEVPTDERRRLLEHVHAWPGPRVLASRSLPEPIPGTLGVRIPTLQRHDAERMFLAMGGTEARFEKLLGPPGFAGWPRPKDTPSPMRATMRLMAETALGVSTLVRAKDGELNSRQDFLRRNIFRQLERSKSEGRVDQALGRWFERQGLRALGTVTWRMLERGQATLLAEDIDWAANVLRLEAPAVEHLHQAVEGLGITTLVGPGEWEFNHKSMAEYCAASALTSGVVPWRELLPRVDDPVVSEILLHLASFATHAQAVIAALLDHPTLPFTGLALATRAIREAPHGSVGMPTVVEVLRRQLLLATWIPYDDLPGGVGDIADTTAVMTAHQAELSEHHSALFEACHPEVIAWLGGTRPHGDVEFHHRGPIPANREEARHRYAEKIALTLGLELPLRTWLLMPNGEEILQARGCGEWARELADLIDDEDDRVHVGARNVWARCLPMHDLLDHLPLLSTSFPHRDRILQAVLHAGSMLQRREALLRTAIADVQFSNGLRGDAETHYALRNRLNDIDSERWLLLWNWAWAVGLLGGATYSEPLERLYEYFAQDDEGPARWRSLVAIFNIHRKASNDHRRERSGNAKLAALRSELERRALLALGDPFRAVRIEAMSISKKLDLKPPPDRILSSLVSTDDDERIVAWSLVLRKDASCTVERLLVLLPAWHERHLVRSPRPPDLDPSPRTMSIGRGKPLTWQRAVRDHGTEARRELESRSRECSTPEDAKLLIRLLGTPRYHTTAEALLRRIDLQPHRDALISILNGEPSPRRRWAAQHLHSLDVPPAALDALRDDEEEEVARAADRHQKWIEHQQHLYDPPSETRAAVIPDEAPAWAMGYSFDEGKGPKLPLLELRELEIFDDFRALMDVLGERSVPWKSATTMEGFFSRDGDGYLDYLATQAASENREIIAEVTKRLVELIRSEHSPQLVADLDHPLRGFWAAQVLARQPMERTLLKAFTTSLRAATRAAMVAAKTPLAGSATDAFIQALTSGKLLVPTDSEQSTRAGFSPPSPRWLTALLVLAGAEGLLRLLVSSPPPSVTRPLLDYLSGSYGLERGPIAGPIRSKVAEWARMLVHQPDVEERLRLLALRLLGRTGTVRDGGMLREWLDSTVVSPDLSAATLNAIGELTGADHLDFLLDVVERTHDMAPLEAAMSAISAHCQPSLVDRMLSWIEHPPRAVRLAMERNERRDRISRARLQRYRRQGERIQDDIVVPPNLGSLMREHVDGWERASALGVARVGSRAQVLRLAELLQDCSWAIELAEEFGRHPEHALLVLGALAHDPGDHAVPASVTGGGDEVYSSDVPGRAYAVVRRIAERTNKKDVRTAFLEAVLWGTSHDAQLLFQDYGGPQPVDVPRLIQHLERSPDDALALQYLAETKHGEQEMQALWRSLDVPWLPS